MAIFDKLKISANEIFTQAYDFIVKTYNRSNKTLTNASPFTQILHVMSEITELILFYNEVSISE